MEFSFSQYFDSLSKLISQSSKHEFHLESVVSYFNECAKNKSKVILIGNGGSAAIASHVAVDLTKNAGIRAINFNEADLITCLSNDYGHEHWMRAALELYADNGDVVVLISSSGKSLNIINAAKYALSKKLKLITLSGMDLSNPLQVLNEGGINLHVPSMAYNHIENVHQAWLLGVVDACIGTAVYKAER